MRLNSFWRTFQYGPYKTMYSEAAKITYNFINGGWQNLLSGFDTRPIGPIYMSEEQLIRDQPSFLDSYGLPNVPKVPELTQDDIQHLIFLTKEANPATFSYALRLPEGDEYNPLTKSVVEKLEILLRSKIQMGGHYWKPMNLASMHKFIRVRGKEGKEGVAYYSMKGTFFYDFMGRTMSPFEPDSWSEILPGCNEFHVFSTSLTPDDLAKILGDKA